MSALRLLDSSWESWTETSRRDELARSLRYAVRNRSVKCTTTDGLVILRGMRNPVSAPIEARSDDDALYELLRSVGCTLPAA